MIESKIDGYYSNNTIRIFMFDLNEMFNWDENDKAKDHS